MTRPPSMFGIVWHREACPSCGRDWWLGADQTVTGEPIANALAPDGLTDAGRRQVAEIRALMGVCADCRGQSLQGP